LDSLHETVATGFLQMDEDERQARAALSRLEANMVRRFSELQRPPL
jgi:F-type H+-transporting ATPase subunit epsilon